MRRIAYPGFRTAFALLLVVATALSLAACATGGSKTEKGVTRLAVENGAVKETAVADFQETVNGSPIPVFVDFFATWCPPCKASAPFIEKLAKEYDGRVLFLRVDTDQATALASSFNIRSIPTFYLIEGGQIQGHLSGYADSMQPDFRALIDKSLS
jgi:thioredoxin 1